MPSWSKITPEQAAKFEAALPNGVERRSMFGCPIAVVNGNMFTGVHNNEINVRLSEMDRERFLHDYEGARIFSPMKGMQMKEYVVVPTSVAQKPALLAQWIRKGFEFASSLPPKSKKDAPAKKGAIKKVATTARGRVTRTVSPLRGMAVDEWVEKKAKGWQKQAIERLLAIGQKAAPKATVSIKWAQPVFELDGPVAFIKPAKAHVTFGFWRGAELTDRDGVLEGGTVMKHLKFASADAIDEKLVARLMREAAALNREKGNPTKKRGK
jgi:TfoX/Sxy family transcriptional regulator of competence genes